MLVLLTNVPPPPPHTHTHRLPAEFSLVLRNRLFCYTNSPCHLQEPPGCTGGDGDSSRGGAGEAGKQGAGLTGGWLCVCVGGEGAHYP